MGVVGFDNGGYSSGSWGWTLLAFSSVLALVLLLRGNISAAPLARLSLAGLLALAAWMLASRAWGIHGTESTREGERALVYVAALAAMIAVVEARTARALLAGVTGATTMLAVYGLGERMVHGPAQNPFEGSLLIDPVGYANALGILCAVGLVVAVGLALDECRPHVVVSLVGAAAVLATALALTSSRGAWLSLVCGLFAMAIIRVARYGLTFVAMAAVGIGLCIAVLGHTGLGERPAYWRAALQDARSHAALGSGAGTFDDFWHSRRGHVPNVRDAHSLYLEALAELGPAGLLLVLLVFLPPLAAAAAARSIPSVGAAAGGYVAFLVHAGLDWDWEMPATTIAGLACGAALLAASRRRTTSRFPERLRLAER